VKWSELFDKMLEKKAEEIKKQRRSNRKPGDRWTPEEIEFLRQNTHLRAREIAEKLGRSLHGVWSKMNRLKIRSKYYWTPEEEQRLRELVAQGLTDKEIGKILGKPPGAIRAKRHRMGLYKGKRRKEV